MFKLNKRIKYALSSLRHTQKNNNITISTKEIANEYNIFQDILAKTLHYNKCFALNTLLLFKDLSEDIKLINY